MLTEREQHKQDKEEFGGKAQCQSQEEYVLLPKVWAERQQHKRDEEAYGRRAQ